jgi:hypothetical protein
MIFPNQKENAFGASAVYSLKSIHQAHRTAVSSVTPLRRRAIVF